MFVLRAGCTNFMFVLTPVPVERFHLWHEWDRAFRSVAAHPLPCFHSFVVLRWGNVLCTSAAVSLTKTKCRLSCGGHPVLR